MNRVYVINVSYECVGSCKLHRALSLVNRCKDCGADMSKNSLCGHVGNGGRHTPKAEIVKFSDKYIPTVDVVVRVPHVVRVFEHIPLYNRRLKYSNRMVWERDAYTCRYCGVLITSKAQLTTDHVKPRSKGGRTCFENMVTACASCNKKKADRPLETSGMRLLGSNPPQIPHVSGNMRKVNDEVQKMIREQFAAVSTA